MERRIIPGCTIQSRVDGDGEKGKKQQPNFYSPVTDVRCNQNIKDQITEMSPEIKVYYTYFVSLFTMNNNSYLQVPG